MLKNYIFLVLCVVILKVSNAQNASAVTNLSEEKLLQIYNEKIDGFNLEEVSLEYLKRAKRQGDSIKLARGYDLLARLYDIKTNLAYSDSIVMVSKNIVNHESYPALGYLLKGAYNYILDNYKDSWDNYELAESYIQEDDIDKQLAYRFGKGAIINTWGVSDLDFELETLKLITSNLDYNSRFVSEFCFINLTIASIYLERNDFNNVLEYIKNAEQYVTKFKKADYLGLVQITKGKYWLQKENFDQAETLYRAVNTELLDNGELANLYINQGKVYEKLEQLDKTKHFFMKVDSLSSNFDVKVLALPYAYNFLLKNAINDKDQELQNRYANKLIKINEEINDNVKYLNAKIYTDNKQNVSDLIAADDTVASNAWGLYLSLILFFCCVMAFLFYRRQFVAEALASTYVQAFVTNRPIAKPEKNEVIVSAKTVIEDAGVEKKCSKPLNISQDVVDHILSELDTFEEQKMYLSYGRLKEVADLIHTNSSYLSKVVNYYKEKSFTNYIHQLRIMESAYQLKSNPTLQSYTIDAISREFGYNNSESFSKAFKKYLGKYPSQYIKDVA